MNWQEIVALTIAAVAAIYVLNNFWHTLRGNKESGCGSGCKSCGKSAENPTLIQPSSDD